MRSASAIVARLATRTRRSTRRVGLPRPLLVAACLCLLGAGTAGCSTTQEKAAAQQAKAERILNARAERQKARKRHKAAHRHDRRGKGNS